MSGDQKSDKSGARIFGVAAVTFCLAASMIVRQFASEKADRKKFNAMMSVAQPEVRILDKFDRNKGDIIVADTVDWKVPDDAMMDKLKDHAIPVMDVFRGKFWFVPHKYIHDMRQ